MGSQYMRFYTPVFFSFFVLCTFERCLLRVFIEYLCYIQFFSVICFMICYNALLLCRLFFVTFEICFAMLSFFLWSTCFHNIKYWALSIWGFLTLLFSHFFCFVCLWEVSFESIYSVSMLYSIFFCFYFLLWFVIMR